MDRVLKFRAWHIADKQMLNEGYNGEVFITTGQLFGYGESVKLMQFTGLKDCKGVEIYEGDIVRVNGRKRVGEYVTTIEWKDGSIVLARNDTYLVDSKAWLDCTVIGNIHQNPELIEG